MEIFDYHDRFHEALRQAFAARDPAVRIAYYELASFYRDKLGGTVSPQPSPRLMKRLAGRLERDAA